MNKFKKFFQDIFTPEVEFILPVVQPHEYTPAKHTLPFDFEVKKIEQGRSTWYEPALSSFTHEITEWDRLIWAAAVLYADTGIRVRIGEAHAFTDGTRISGMYTMSGPFWSDGGSSFDLVWATLEGVGTGYECAHRGYGNRIERKI